MRKATESESEESNNVATILLVDDYPIIRQYIRILIDAEPDMQVCAETACWDEIVQLLESVQPDVAVVDISLNGPHNGIELTRMLTEASPHTRVLILSMHNDVAFAQRALAAGATGYAIKSEPPQDIIQAIRKILQGQTYACRDLSSRLLQEMVRTSAHQEILPVSTLSTRELTIFELLGRERSTREIAKQLNISEKTVTTHRANIRKKLGCKSASDLTKQARAWFSNTTR
jgi:DNA-binding NarL/FixJ family response regulator